MNAIYKFVMSMLAKRGGKTGLTTIPKASGLNVELSVKQIEQTLTNMGVDVSKITSPKEVEKFLNIQQSWLNQQVKQKAKNIGLMDSNKNIFMKKGPFEGFTPKVVPKPENIMGGMEAVSARNKKIQDLAAQLAKMQKEKSAMYGKTDIVTDTVTKIKTMEPVAAMKEANSVIGRKGIYKNLTKEQSQKILKDTDDWIFQRDPDDLYDYNKKRPFRDDPDFDPEDFAQGGRTGSGLNYLLGEDDQNSRVPYASGSRKKESWRDKLTRWGGGPSMIAGDLGFEGLNQIYQLLGMGGLYAEGGRTGFGIGGLTRRAFLKLMGGAAAGTAAAKSGLFSLLKGGAKKSVIKDLTSVPIKSGADGMPLWFKPFVNKVIKEGDDVTKNYATLDRQIVHKTELPDSGTDVLVTQDLTTGNVSVDIGLTKHGFADGKFGQPVRLEYKASEVIEPTHIENIKSGSRFEQTGKPTKTKEEFWVEEAEFTGGNPENVKFEESSFEKFGKHESDFSEVEAFAKGTKKKTRKISPLQKEGEDLADHFSNYPTPDDYASGGRVPLFAGGPAWKKFIEMLFIKSSNQIRQGAGKWKGLTQEQWIKQHDNLTKKLKEFELGGYKKIPEGMKEYFGMNEIQLVNAFKKSQTKAKNPLQRELQEASERTGKVFDPRTDQYVSVDKNIDILQKFTPKGKPHAEGGIIGRVPYWGGGSWKMIKEAIKHNKIFGLGGPPYKPGATSFDIKKLTKDRFGRELSLQELKEMVSKSNIRPDISSRQFKEAEETLPKFLTGFKEYKADVIKQQLLDAKQNAKLRIKVSKDMLKNPQKGLDPAMNKKVSEQMIRDAEKQLKDLDAALKDIDIYKAMKEKTGVSSHASGGRVSLSSGGLAGMLGE